MDRQKISRSLCNAAEGVKVKVKSSCATPISVLTEDQNASIYEIEILSSFDFHKSKKKEMIDVPVKVSFAKAATRVLEAKRKENKEEFKVLEIPLMESYYPTFQETQSEIKEIPLSTGQMGSKVQTGLNFDDKRHGEREMKSSKEKADKENQSPSDNFKQILKNIIVENFISEDDSTTKILFKKFCEKLNKEQLHFHHHEHHHHYHFDNSVLLNENESQSFPFKQTFNKATKARGGSKCSKDRKYSTGKGRIAEKEQPKHTYYFKCPGESNLTFTKKDSGKILKSENDEPSNVSKTKKSSGTFDISRMKFSSSVESILNKKSDFITTHIYSDTELTKCDSQTLHMAEISECETNRSEESHKDAANGYGFLMDTLKNINHFMPSAVIANQKMTPQISYLRSARATLKNSNAIPDDRPFDNVKSSSEFLNTTKLRSSEKNVYCTSLEIEGKEKTHSAEGKSDEYEYLKKEKKDKYQNLLPFMKQKNKEDFLSQMEYEIWTAKLKTELEEIKKELKRIQEKYLQKKKSFTLVPNENKTTENSENSHKITVYSSKTFILGANSVYITQKRDHERFEEKLESLFQKSKLPYEGLEIELYQNEKDGAPEEKKGFLKEHCITSQHQVFSNDFYKMSSKIFD